MNTILLNLQSAFTNKHVSIPVVLAVACELGAVWLPQYGQQFKVSGRILLGYGTLAAANSGPANKGQNV